MINLCSKYEVYLKTAKKKITDDNIQALAMSSVMVAIVAAHFAIILGS